MEQLSQLEVRTNLVKSYQMSDLCKSYKIWFHFEKWVADPAAYVTSPYDSFIEKFQFQRHLTYAPYNAPRNLDHPRQKI